MFYREFSQLQRIGMSILQDRGVWNLCISVIVIYLFFDFCNLTRTLKLGTQNPEQIDKSFNPAAAGLNGLKGHNRIRRTLTIQAAG
jgi:hypothetical protein